MRFHITIWTWLHRAHLPVWQVSTSPRGAPSGRDMTCWLCGHPSVPASLRKLKASFSRHVHPRLSHPWSRFLQNYPFYVPSSSSQRSRPLHTCPDPPLTSKELASLLLAVACGHLAEVSWALDAIRLQPVDVCKGPQTSASPNSLDYFMNGRRIKENTLYFQTIPLIKN